MLHLTGRTNLILRCMEQAPSRTCRRAFGTGKVEVLGLFEANDPSISGPGWILRVTSINGTDWYLRLTPVVAEYTVERIDKVNWKNWRGDSSDLRYTLKSGDNPGLYGRLRDAEI